MCRVYYSYCNFEKELKEMKETHICSMTKTNHRRNGEIWNMKNGNPLYYSFVECQWNYRDSIYCLPPAWHSFLLHCIYFFLFLLLVCSRVWKAFHVFALNWFSNRSMTYRCKKGRRDKVEEEKEGKGRVGEKDTKCTSSYDCHRSVEVRRHSVA